MDDRLLWMIGGKKVEMLRDTGCSGVIMRRELVDERDFTREKGHITTVDRMDPNSAHKEEVNCALRYNVMPAGMPNREIQ